MSKNAERLGAEVAKIMNEARNNADQILKKYGYKVNINIDFCKLEESLESTNNESEVLSEHE